MNIKYITFGLLIIMLVARCTTTSNLTGKQTKTTVMHNLQIGSSWGGIIENMEVDAVTGATKNRLNAGYHAVIKVQNKMLETGVDLLNYQQSFTFTDTDNYNGKRNFNYREVRLPLTYNFQLWRNKNNNGIFRVKTGLSAGYRYYQKIEDSGNLPGYSFKRFSMGPTLGISLLPISITDDLSIGTYIDFLLASKVYNDYYTKAPDIGNMSYIKFGIFLELK